MVSRYYFSWVAAIVFLAALMVPLITFAATFKANDEVSITNQDDTNGNVYAAGGAISINTPIGGDLLTAGGNVLITEPVAKDVAVAGGSITIIGDVGDDVRAAGGNIVVTGNINGELIAAGGSITLSNSTNVGNDVVIAAGQATLNGNINGDVRLMGGVATINGRIQGNVLAELEETITISDGAVIEGNILYKAKRVDALNISDGATVTGEVFFEEMAIPDAADVENVVAAALGAFLIFKLFSTIVVALVLMWLFKNFSVSVVRVAINEPLRMLGYGFVTLIVVPAAAIILLITLLGIPLGIASLLSYGLLLLLSCLYSGVVAGSWVGNIISSKETISVNWKNVVGGIVLLTLIKLVPVVGWIIAFFIFLITLGSLSNIVHKKFWQAR